MTRVGPGARGEKGFSLIELLVVLALIGLAVVVGYPSMQEWLDRYQVRSAASEIAANIQLQRMRAVSQNAEFSIEFDGNANTYTLYQGDPNTGTMLDVIARSLPQGVGFNGNADPIEVANDTILFHPDGSLNDSTANTDTISVGNGQAVFEVQVNRATGRVEVEHQSHGY
jgi:prepilin-type N-terminal cleavage/methylation domain-containing protein